MAEKPFIELGGDSRQAVASIEDVVSAFRKLDREGKKTGKGMGRSFGLAGKAVAGFNKTIKAQIMLFRTSRRVMGGVISVYRKLRFGLLALGGSVAGVTALWNKEAEAQGKINAILKANIRDYPRARRELDKIIRTVQRTTNFGDRDVEGIFSLLTGMAGQQGFEAARRLTPTFLDIEAATGGSFRAAEMAKKTAKALKIRDPGEFREVGIVVNKAKFRADPIGTLQETLSGFAGAAAGARAGNPFPAFIKNFGDVLENIGFVFANQLNPALERAALWANDMANSFKPQSFKELWEGFTEKAAKAWEIITKVAVASWAAIKAFFMRIFSGAATGFKQGLGGMSLAGFMGSLIRKGTVPTVSAAGQFTSALLNLFPGITAQQAQQGPQMQKASSGLSGLFGRIFGGLGRGGKRVGKGAGQLGMGALGGASMAGANMIGSGAGFGAQMALMFGLAQSIQDPTSPFRQAVAGMDIAGAGADAKNVFEQTLGFKLSDIPKMLGAGTKSKTQQQGLGPMPSSAQTWQLNQAKNALEFAQADRYFREKFANSSYYESEGSFGQGLSGQDFADARIMFPHVMGFQSNRSHFKSLYGRTNESLSADTDNMNFRRGAIVAVN